MTWREITRRRLARLITRLSDLTGWPECACGRRHDPREHYPLHDDD